MYVSKEKAKQIIDKAPGMIWIDSFNGITFIHTKPKQISIDEGKRIINKASTVDYFDNDFFGHLCLEMQTEMIHNIKFPLSPINRTWKIKLEHLFDFVLTRIYVRVYSIKRTEQAIQSVLPTPFYLLCSNTYTIIQLKIKGNKFSWLIAIKLYYILYSKSITLDDISFAIQQFISIYYQK